MRTIYRRKLLKQAESELAPLLLKLVNTTIKTTLYPDSLKTTKVVPIEKLGKDKTTSDGWRPINVVAALSKVIERVLLKQILDHLQTNELLGAQHHGAIEGRSTQTTDIRPSRSTGPGDAGRQGEHIDST